MLELTEYRFTSPRQQYAEYNRARGGLVWFDGITSIDYMQFTVTTCPTLSTESSG